MSDIYMPGVRSRFNTEKIIEDLMNLERIPRDRVEKNIENLQSQRGYWQEVGRRITSLRNSAASLYNHENPFSDRIVKSSNDAVITATTIRGAPEQSYAFTVKQTAQADRYLSQPLDERMRVEAGNYRFSVGSDEISINFRGGTLKDFVDIINRQGRDKIAANLLAVQSGTKSLLIESKVTGKENRLSFSGDTIDLVTRVGMMEQGDDSRSVISINESTVRKGNQNISINDGVLQLTPRSSATLPLNLSLSADSPVMLKLETLTKVGSGDSLSVVQPPPGPSVLSGSVTYGGITVQNAPSNAPLPDFKVPPAPVRNDSMDVLTLTFSDGTSAKLAPITDSNGFTTRQYLLSNVAQGRTIVSLNLNNENTHREISVGKIEIFDPTSTTGGLRPLNAVSTARDAVITMEGIEISRPTNNINDLVPGLTLNVRGVSEKPVDLSVKADIEGIKDSLISFVYNYNRLMLEINVLTRKDDRIVDEVTYLTADESTEMRGKLGVFSSDSTLLNLKNNLMRIVTAPYPTDLERDLSMLAQIGISSSAGRPGGGYDPSLLRGYLAIDENILDAALETKVAQIRQLFASSTLGDVNPDTGVAYNLEAHAKSFVGTGGIISLKTNTIDSRISQDERRVTSLDRQLAAKEQELRIQYARMESAYSRMEQMTNSLDNFNQQNRNNR
jgi:flagellar hook-associated protein 2